MEYLNHERKIFR